MKRIYVIRKDGIVQRYSVKNVKNYIKIGRFGRANLYVKKIPKVEKVVERYVKRYVVVPEIPEVPEIPKKLWRYSYGIKWFEVAEQLAHPIPLHRKYYGALIQAWHTDRKFLRAKEEILKSILIRMLELFLGYRINELWFLIDDGEGYSQVKYDKALDNRWVARIEDSRGVTIVEESGEL